MPSRPVPEESVEAFRRAEKEVFAGISESDGVRRCLQAAAPAIPEQERERLLGEKAQVVVVDFLCSWSFCPVSQAEAPARSCLEDAAKQLLAAIHPDQPKEDSG